jgi:hypothetical protein
MKRMLCCTLVILLAVAAAGCGVGEAVSGPAPTVVAEWPTWDSVAALAAEADLVVIGTVGPFIDRWTVTAEDGRVLATDTMHEFLVDEVLAGDVSLKGTRIPVGYSDLPVENITPFNEGERLLLFLDRFDWNGAHDGWVPLASDSGVFDIRGKGVVARGVVGPLAGLRLPMKDLRAEVARGAPPG